MYENPDFGSANAADDFWVALHDCPPGFTNFGIVGGRYQILLLQESWQNVENACNDIDPNVHLAGLYHDNLYS